MSTNISYYNFKSIFTTTKSSQIRFFNSLESIAKISTTFKTLKIVFKNYNLLSVDMTKRPFKIYKLDEH